MGKQNPFKFTHETISDFLDVFACPSNPCGGTDRGTAGPVFPAGEPVQAGVLGAHPNLSELEQNAPKHTVDFRKVYATVLDEWLGIPSGQVLGGSFGSMRLFA